MKYNIKYGHLKPLEVQDNILRGAHAGPCWHCGEMTEFIEINYEAYLCSDECEWAKDEEMNKACNNYCPSDPF